jgi:hypothetical protein
MLRGLRAAGFDSVVATPHMRPGMFDNDRASLERAYEAMGPILQGQSDLPAVHLSSEHFFDDVVFGRLLRGEALPYPERHEGNDRRHRPGLRRAACRARLRAQVPGHRRLRHPRREGRELQRGFDRNHEQSAEVLKATVAEDDERPADLRGHVLRRGRAHARRPQQRPRPDARRARERDRRARAVQGRRRRLRVHRLPGRDRGRLRPHPRAGERASPRRRLHARLLARAHQPGRQGAHAREDHKVVSGEDAATLERVAAAYGAIVDAGVHRAPSIKVAEAAKVIENTQRDLNIALMNELAIIFDRMGIRTATCSPRRHQVELPQVQAGPRRRPLHRRRPVLPDDEGAAARLPARGHPRRAGASTTTWARSSRRSS